MTTSSVPGDYGEAARETERLDRVALVYDPSDPTTEFDYVAKRFQLDVLRPWLHGQRVLEMGCATGELTSLVAPVVDEYEVVEGAATNIEAARKRTTDVTFHHGLWESFAPTGRYSDILMVNALEHVDDPVGILERAKQWLLPGGRIHIIVPNADSLHRYVGVEIGMLPTRKSLSESDVRVEHRRVYDLDDVITDVERAGCQVLHWQGILLKILSNQQMLGWSFELIRAMHNIGQRFPSYCSELYVVAIDGP